MQATRAAAYDVWVLNTTGASESTPPRVFFLKGHIFEGWFQKRWKIVNRNAWPCSCSGALLKTTLPVQVMPECSWRWLVLYSKIFQVKNCTFSVMTSLVLHTVCNLLQQKSLDFKMFSITISQALGRDLKSNFSDQSMFVELIWFLSWHHYCLCVFFCLWKVSSTLIWTRVTHALEKCRGLHAMQYATQMQFGMQGSATGGNQTCDLVSETSVAECVKHEGMCFSSVSRI